MARILGAWERLATAAQCRALDQDAMARLGIPGVALMEVAGRGAAHALLDALARHGRLQEGDAVTALICCGGGNNGGDGCVMARHLLAMGHAPTVVMLADPARLVGDAAWALATAKAAGVSVVALDEATAPDAESFLLAWSALVGARPWSACVDALFGTGLRRPLEGHYAAAVGALSLMRAWRVALDLPSGLSADTGQPLSGAVMRADQTITFGCAKPGLHLEPGRSLCGEVACVDLGFVPSGFEAAQVRGALLTRASVKPWMRPRPRDSHKGTWGRALILGGQPGQLGAAVMAGAAALRAGAGLVTVGTREDMDVSAVAQTQWELMGAPLLPAGPLTEARAAALGEAASAASVIAVGPGMGRSPGTIDALKLLLDASSPLVLDADALNILSDDGRLSWLRARSARGLQTVLTPHPGEFGRLWGCSASEVLAQRLAFARAAATDWGAVVVLKSGSTVIANPDGQFAVNATGTPGMATAGMGDVLTGLIAGLIAQRLSPWDAACVGVCLHGLAGEAAERDWGQRALTATTLLAALGPLTASLEAQAPNGGAKKP
jgi:hydroxyethylthiazole kinase-like uncharacterized protein yjeF